MVPRPPGSRVKLGPIAYWPPEEPEEGDLLRTDAGSCYLIDEIKRNAEGKPRHLLCTKLEKDAVQFGAPGVWRWCWSERSRRRAA